MDLNVFNILKSKGQEYGLPVEVWYPIANLESGGNPAAVGDNGTSFGLFQIHLPANPSFDTSRYTDPGYQADFQFPELKKYYDQGVKAGLSGEALTSYVEQYGQRPKWTDQTSKGINDAYQSMFTTPLTSGGVSAENTSIMSPKAAESTAGAAKNVGGSLNPLNWLDYLKSLMYKAAFFIPALILLTIGLVMLFAQSETGQETIKAASKAAIE